MDERTADFVWLGVAVLVSVAVVALDLLKRWMATHG
jgi:hypothetical protein